MSTFSHTLDPSGAVGVLGDWVCLKTDGTVTRAITSALTTYGAVYGCIVVGGNPGTSVTVLTEGAVPPSISGLAALSGKARVNGSTARAERVASLTGSDYPIGDIDASGSVEFGNEPASVSTRAQLKAVTTPKHGAFVYVVDSNVHFVFSATTSTADDGVDVLAPNDSSRGRWLVSSYSPAVGDEHWVPAGATVATFNAAAADAATIAASTGRKQTIRLEAGDYYAQAGESWNFGASGVVFQGAGKGRTYFRAASAPNISLADDRTNVLGVASGTVRTDILSTVLTTDISYGGAAWYGEGARKVSVASLDTVAVGQWIQIGGTDVTGRGNPAGQSGSNYQTGELLKVAALQTSPNRITFEWPTRQHHSRDVSGVGGTTPFVRAVDPITDVEVHGITFVSTSHAVGLRFDLCARVILGDLEFVGFTRSPIETGLGCMDFTADGELIFESSNGGLYLRSLVLGRLPFRTSPKGSKIHPLGGYHRAALFAEHGCTGLDLSGSHVCNRVKAFDWRGTAGNCVADHVRVDDIHFYAQTNPPPNTAGPSGVIDFGSGEIGDDEHCWGVRMHDLLATNCYFDPNDTGLVDINDYYRGVICGHDTTQMDIEGEIRAGQNLTTVDGDAKYVTPGVVLQDAGGRCKVRCVGTLFGFSLRSATQYHLLDGCEHQGAPGQGPVSVASLVIKYGAGFEVRDFYGQGYTWFTSDYGSSVTPYALKITGSYSMDGEIVQGPLRVCTFSGATAENGEVWAVDSTATSGTTKLKVPSASSEHFVIAHGRNNLSGWPNGGFGLFGEVGQGAMLVSGAGNAGDTVDVSSGSNTAVATGGTTVGPWTIGRLLETKGSGTALVKVARIR